MEYANKIVQIREGVKKRNKRYSIKKGEEIHVIAFKIFTGLIFIVLSFLFATYICGRICSRLDELIPVNLLIFIMLVIEGVIISLFIDRGLQLKNQKDKFGTYKDYKEEIKEIDLPGVSPHIAYMNPIADFIAHNLVVFISPIKDYYKPALNLNDKELKAGGYILKNTENNRALKFEELEESDEYKVLTQEEISNLFKILEELDYIVIHKTAVGKSIVQIDQPQSEVAY